MQTYMPVDDPPLVTARESARKRRGIIPKTGNAVFEVVAKRELETISVLAFVLRLGQACSESVTPSEIAAVRCVVESCASELDDAWAEA